MTNLFTRATCDFDEKSGVFSCYRDAAYPDGALSYYEFIPKDAKGSTNIENNSFTLIYRSTSSFMLDNIIYEPVDRDLKCQIFL